MATTTPNFGWSVPTSTDLVKDGATAIETLGDSIDASLLDLKGGTSGQVLAKNSNTDMDFIWVAQDDSNAIQNAIVDAKGDIIAASAADTPARLAVGTNGQVLTADSTAGTGLAWATAASGGMTLINAGGTTLTGASVSVTGIPTDSTYKHLLVVWKNVYNATAGGGFYIRPNGDTSGSNYAYGQIRVIGTTVTGGGDLGTPSYMTISDRTGSSSSNDYIAQAACWIYRYTDTDGRGMNSQCYSSNGTDTVFQSSNGSYFGGSAISSITTFGDYNFSGGKIYVYGVN